MFQDLLSNPEADHKVKIIWIWIGLSCCLKNTTHSFGVIVRFLMLVNKLKSKF